MSPSNTSVCGAPSSPGHTHKPPAPCDYKPGVCYSSQGAAWRVVWDAVTSMLQRDGDVFELTCVEINLLGLLLLLGMQRVSTCDDGILAHHCCGSPPSCVPQARRVGQHRHAMQCAQPVPRFPCVLSMPDQLVAAGRWQVSTFSTRGVLLRDYTGYDPGRASGNPEMSPRNASPCYRFCLIQVQLSGAVNTYLIERLAHARDREVAKHQCHASCAYCTSWAEKARGIWHADLCLTKAFVHTLKSTRTHLGQ